MKVTKLFYLGLATLFLVALSASAQDFTPTLGITLSNHQVGQSTDITFTFVQDNGELDCDSIYMVISQGVVPYSDLTVGEIVGHGTSHMAGTTNYTIGYNLVVMSVSVPDMRASVQGVVTSSNYSGLPIGSVIYHHEVVGNNTDIMVTTWADTADGNNWTMGVHDTTYFNTLLVLPHAQSVSFAFVCVSEPDNSSIVHYFTQTISVTLGVKETPEVTPATYSLAQNYPNPFNSETWISYSVPVTSKVVLNVYNTEGRLVRTLVNAQSSPGIHRISWNGLSNTGAAVSTGVYLYRLQAGDFSAIHKMVYLR
jgi:hypothetical protein